MKKFIALALLFFIIQNVPAQLSFAPRVVGYITQEEDILKTPDGYISVQKERKAAKDWAEWYTIPYSLKLVKLDSKMNKLQDKTLSNGEMIYGPFKPRLIHLSNKYYLIYGDLNKKKYLNNIYYAEVNEKTLETSSPQLLVSADDINVKQSGSFENLDIKFQTSPDNNYCCLYIMSYEKPFFLAAFDKNLATLWKGEQRIFKLERYEIKSVVIGNDGTVYISSVSYDNEVTVTSYSTKGVATNNTIDFGSVKPHHVELKWDASGNLYAGGTLRKDSKFINTVFIARLENNVLKDMKQAEIPASILKRLDKDGLAKSGGITDQYFLKPELVLQQDGKFKIVMECKSYISGDRYTAYGSVLIVDLDLPGDKFFHIPKYQLGINTIRKTNSICTMAAGHSITVFYVDHIDNLDRQLSDDQKVLRQFSDATVIAATLDNNGKLTRKRVTDNNYGTSEQTMTAFMLNADR